MQKLRFGDREVIVEDPGGLSVIAGSLQGDGGDVHEKGEGEEVEAEIRRSPG